MTRTRLIFVPSDGEPAPWMLSLDEAGAVLERRSLQAGVALPAGAQDILVVPGTEVAAHWLHLPTKNMVQARAAARLLLEDRLSRPDEAVHLAVGAAGPDDHRLVATVARPVLDGWLELARSYGAEPDVVLPDHLLLPEPAADEILAADMGGWVAVRGPRMAFSCEVEMLEILLPDQKVRLATSPEALERLWAEGARAPAVNLLQGIAGADRQPLEARDLRRLAGLAAALLLAPATILAIETWRYGDGARKAEAAAVAELDQVLPKGRPIGDPLIQAQAHLRGLELAAGGGPAGAAASLFVAVESIEGAQIESLVASQDGLRAAISHGTAADVATLAASMRKAGFAFREESTRDMGGRVMSDVMIGSRL